MKLRLVLFSLLASAFLNDLLAVPPVYTKLPDGIILFTDTLFRAAQYLDLDTTCYKDMI